MYIILKFEIIILFFFIDQTSAYTDNSKQINVLASFFYIKSCMEKLEI